MTTVRDFFATPHDRPPDWLFMLTAYLDESGQETNDFVVVAGFLGNDEQWKQCENSWQEGLGKRKGLHMKDLYWGKDRTRVLLKKLGPIPHQCGLTALVTALNVQDYYDLVVGTQAEQMTKGYYLCVMAVIDSILKNTSKEETIKLVFEAQDRFATKAHMVFNSAQKLTPSGKPRLSSIEFISKDSSVLTQPSDYLAYAKLQDLRDPQSKKAKWCTPILDIQRPAFGRLPSAENRDKWRKVIKDTLIKSPDFWREANET